MPPALRAKAQPSGRSEGGVSVGHEDLRCACVCLVASTPHTEVFFRSSRHTDRAHNLCGHYSPTQDRATRTTTARAATASTGSPTISADWSRTTRPHEPGRVGTGQVRASRVRTSPSSCRRAGRAAGSGRSARRGLHGRSAARSPCESVAARPCTCAPVRAPGPSPAAARSGT